MLASEYRLRSASDISRTYKRGAYGGSGGVLSIKAATSGRLTTRALVVVPKKVSKRAHIRNRIRRRLIERLRESWATVPTGYDIVISVHADISDMPIKTVADHLTRALDRAGIKVS